MDRRIHSCLIVLFNRFDVEIWYNLLVEMLNNIYKIYNLIQIRCLLKKLFIQGYTTIYQNMYRVMSIWPLIHIWRVSTLLNHYCSHWSSFMHNIRNHKFYFLTWALSLFWSYAPCFSWKRFLWTHSSSF